MTLGGDDMENDFRLLKELCEMPGVSGFEEPAQAIAERELKKNQPKQSPSGS